MTILDFRGNEIKPGVRVAYNFSGAVVLGTVVKAEIKKRNQRIWGESYEYNFHIRLDFPAGGKKVGHISKVKNKSSIIVLD